MSMTSTSRIRSIINAIDSKLGAKTISLTSGIEILCSGYAGTKGTTYTPLTTEGGGVQVDSLTRLRVLLDRANQTTGYNDTNLTAAVQRLCDGYDEGEKLYSFGALADLHIQYNTGVADLQRSLDYLNGRVPFVCVCGDLVSYANAEHMAQYATWKNTFNTNLPIYECAGNHESYPSLGVGGDIDEALWESTTGHDLFYSFPYGKDLFIMFSMKSERANDLWPDGAMDWLAATLEANDDKRVFLFQHAPELADRSADPSGTWSTLMEGTSGQAFVALIKQYPNVIWFHGHTHVTLGVERYPINEEVGYRSVHIPSLVSPRFYMPEISNTLIDSYVANGTTIWGSMLSEGYIVDVYNHKIVLRGINFAAGANRDQVEPMADEVYALDTM